jgi:hypothetical protein
VYGKINSSVVGVAEGVKVIVGKGEGEEVSITTGGGGRVAGKATEGED